jgi:peptide/nickel transport system permease protein
MARYLLRRLVMTLVVVLLVMTFLSVVIHLVPGEPASVILGPRATPDLVRAVREQMHLDDPVWKQVWLFGSNAAQGNFGHDFITGLSIASIVGNALPYTATLALAALLLATVVGVPLGVYAATRPNTIVDRVAALFSVSFITIPSYVAGLYFLLLFALTWPLLPAVGAGTFSHPLDYLKHLVLPASALAVTWVGYIARLVRTSMLEVRTANYIRTAQAVGLRERQIFYKYALKNAVIPTVAVLSVGLGDLMAGAVFIEVIFSRPGLGTTVVNAIETRNFPIVQASVLVIALIYVSANLVADLSYRFLDPRIRVEEAPAA